MQRISQSSGWTAQLANGGSETLDVLSLSVNEEGVIEVIRSEDLAAIGRPAHTQLVEKIAGDFDEPGLDENLGGGNVQLLDKLDHLREEMDVGRNEQAIAALVGDDAHAPDQVADGPDGAGGIAGALDVGLSAEPGEIAFLFDVLLQLEIVLWLGSLILQLLLLVGLVGGLPPLVHAPHPPRAL